LWWKVSVLAVAVEAVLGIPEQASVTVAAVVVAALGNESC
jgi:hypothetical protein